MILMSADSVFQTIVQYVGDNIQIRAPDRIGDQSLRLAGSETGAGGRDNERLFLIVFEDNITFMCMVTLFTPVYNILVNPVSKLCAAWVNDYSESSDRDS